MGWEWYNWIAIFLLASQGLFLYQSWRNYRYALAKSRRINEYYHPRVLLTVPCKGIDREFEKNISSVLHQDYPDFVLHFVVEDASDPAYESLNRLIASIGPRCRASRIEVLVAGKGQECSQKIHNLLYSCRRAPGRNRESSPLRIRTPACRPTGSMPWSIPFARTTAVRRPAIAGLSRGPTTWPRWPCRRSTPRSPSSSATRCSIICGADQWPCGRTCSARRNWSGSGKTPSATIWACPMR